MRQYAIAIALAALAAAHAPARTVRVTVEGAAAQAARGVPLVIEEWGVITNADGSVTRHPYAKSVVAAARNEMETTCAVTSGVVRIGLVSAVTGTVSAAILGSGRTWVNQAADSSGVLALVGGYALPRATSRPVGTVDYGLGALDVDARRWALYGGADVAATNRGAVRVRVAWTSPGFADEAYAELPLDEAPAGTSLVAVTADLDGNGAYTPGEPYGVAVSTNGVFDGGVTLTWTSPSILRIDLAQAVGANTFDAQKGLCDRGIRVWGTGADVDAGSIDNIRLGTDMPPSTVPRLPLRLVRSAFNGNITSNRTSTTTTYYTLREIGDANVNFSDDPFLSEATLLSRGVLDLDWNLDSFTYVIGTRAAITSITYRVLAGDGAVDPRSSEADFLATAFVNRFEGVRTKCTPVSPVSTNEAIVGALTLAWRHDNPLGKNYPAFRLRIWSRAAGANTAYILYDTGDRQAPARSVTGEYRWTAPVRAGDGTFAGGSNYWWSVSMLDAKFVSPDDTETRAAFRMPAQEGSEQ